MTDATWLWLDRLGILLGIVTGIITLLALTVGIFSRERLRRWLSRNRFPAIGGTLAEDVRYDGLVFTISKLETPEWVLGQIGPRAVVLVASEESRGVADEIKARATTITDVFATTIHDPDDPRDTQLAVRQAVERLQATGCTRIAVDITGGKIPMSLGAFIAAEELGLDSLYVSAKYDPRLNRPDMRTAHIRVVSRPVGNS